MIKKKRLTKDEVKYMLQLCKSGVSRRAVMNMFDLTRKGLEYHLKKNGLIYGNKISNDVVNEIICLYKNNENYNVSDVAKEVGLLRGAVRKILIRNNVKIRNDRSRISRKYDINENIFDKIDNEKNAYVLGMLYADGSCHEASNSIQIYLHVKDIDIIKKMINVIYPNGRKICPKSDNMFGFKITNKRISEKAKNMGLVDNKAAILTFPFKHVDEAMHKHFIRGYFDGDGGISIRNKKTGQLSISSSVYFCNDIKKIFENRLGISSNVYKRVRNNASLEVYGNKKILKLLGWMYDDSNIYMNRKNNKYLKLKNLVMK